MAALPLFSFIHGAQIQCMLVAGVRRVPSGNGMPQARSPWEVAQRCSGQLQPLRGTAHCTMSRRRHIQSPVTIGTVRGFQCFPPSPQNRVLAQPTPLHRPTSQLPPLAITTTPSPPSLPVQVIAITAITTITTITIIAIITTITTTTPLLPLRFCN
ncbi:hypothetical protein E4U39_002513 [Claviceps sp. Clav50 group G5]|nr:hypothetical protein E4U39_002513 [Claviceps sp. Clav50 group G5]